MWNDQKVSKMSALHLTMSKSVQIMVATGRGVHTNATGQSMFPFHIESSEAEWKNKKPSKKEYKVRLNIRERRRKNKNAKEGSQDWQYEFCA